jgi:hypothetical protein
MASSGNSKSLALVAALVITGLPLPACSSSEGSTDNTSGGTTSGGTTSGGTTSGSSGAQGGSCSGDIANCPIGTLSAAQQNDMCSILAAATDDPPGTKLECTKGGDSVYIVVNSKDDCVAKPAAASCKVTVTYLVNCFKQAKKDACSALGADGACAQLFDPASGCSG